jgi:hypothetical protein
MTRPSPRDLFAEAAELAYHFHWPLETILDLEHRDRRVFLDEAADLSLRYEPEPEPEPVETVE